MLMVFPSVNVRAYVLCLCEGGKKKFPSAGTIAKFISKSTLFVLLLNEAYSLVTNVGRCFS